MSYTTEGPKGPRDLTRLEQAVGDVERALAEAEQQRDEAQQQVDHARKRLESLVNPNVAKLGGSIPSRTY